MGVIYTIQPLTDDICEWINELGGTNFTPSASRFPTGKEIKNSLNNLSNFSIEITDNYIGYNWQAFIRSEIDEICTLINIFRIYR